MNEERVSDALKNVRANNSKIVCVGVKIVMPSSIRDGSICYNDNDNTGVRVIYWRCF